MDEKLLRSWRGRDLGVQVLQKARQLSKVSRSQFSLAPAVPNLKSRLTCYRYDIQCLLREIHQKWILGVSNSLSLSINVKKDLFNKFLQCSFQIRLLILCRWPVPVMPRRVSTPFLLTKWVALRQWYLIKSQLVHYKCSELSLLVQRLYYGFRGLSSEAPFQMPVHDAFESKYPRKNRLASWVK